MMSALNVESKLMKYFNSALDVSKELAEVLLHNKYLLDDPKLLEIVIYNRMLTGMGEAYREGKEQIIPISDLSHLNLNFLQGAN